jgi:glucosamine-phosphate N-acetyltransferase
MDITYLPLKTFIKENFIMMHIIHKKYMDLLSNLSISPDIEEKLFIEKVFEISDRGIILIGYIGSPDSPDTFEIVSTGTVYLEMKLTHGCRPVGHIEDIVINPSYRGQGLSTILIEKLLKFSRNENCYKVILTCKQDITRVYESCGFLQKGVEMEYRFY